MVAKTIGGHIADRGETVLALGDEIDQQASEEAAEHLNNPVARQDFPLDAPGERRAERDRRIEMPAGDRAERVDTGEHGQAEGEGHPEKTDPHRDTAGEELGGEHRATAATKYQPECADRLRCQSMKHGWSSHALPLSPFELVCLA